LKSLNKYTLAVVAYRTFFSENKYYPSNMLSALFALFSKGIIYYFNLILKIGFALLKPGYVTL
jgi:hypothetical protein